MEGGEAGAGGHGDPRAGIGGMREGRQPSSLERALTCGCSLALPETITEGAFPGSSAEAVEET